MLFARPVTRGALVVAAALGVLGLLGPSPASAAPRGPKVAVAVGDTKVFAVGGKPDALPADVRTGVLTTVTAYLRATATRVADPAAADAALTPLMTAGAAARLAGPDRGTLLDEGLPAPTGKVTVTADPVGLTALADDGGSVVLVTADLDATTVVPTRAGKVRVHRTGALVLVPDAGSWKVQGYQLTVERSGRKLGTAAGTPVTTLAPAVPATGATGSK